MKRSRNRQSISARPDEVFAVLSDPTTYPEWLVGAQRIDHVDGDWPEPGSVFSHRVGVGPALVAGSTTVRRCDAPELLELAAGMGPFGEVLVTFTVEPEGVVGPDGGTGSIVTLAESPSRGIARLALRLGTPLVIASLWGRNSVSLSQLATVVEQRDGATTDDAQS